MPQYPSTLCFFVSFTSLVAYQTQDARSFHLFARSRLNGMILSPLRDIAKLWSDSHIMRHVGWLAFGLSNSQRTCLVATRDWGRAAYPTECGVLPRHA